MRWKACFRSTKHICAGFLYSIAFPPNYCFNGYTTSVQDLPPLKHCCLFDGVVSLFILLVGTFAISLCAEFNKCMRLYL